MSRLPLSDWYSKELKKTLSINVLDLNLVGSNTLGVKK